MSNPHKVKPQLNAETTKEMNLAVLQRLDQSVEEILSTAAHVTVYEFDVEDKAWSRKDVEGSLFVVKREYRREQPRFQFIVMNRRSSDNLVEDLLGDFEFEVQMPYLLYRNAVQEVNGIWFYHKMECERTASLFTRILNAFSKNIPKPKLFAPVSEDFKELEAVPSNDTVSGPLEPMQSPSAASSVNADNGALERFFSSTLQIATATQQSQAPNSTTSSISSFLQPSVNISPEQEEVVQPVFLQPSTSPLYNVNGAADAAVNPIRSTTSSTTGSVLLKPSFFVPPSCEIDTPSLPQTFGTPFLQPFPPPAPPVSLAGATIIGSDNCVISKDSVQKALSRLAQDERFVELVYQELLNQHSLP